MRSAWIFLILCFLTWCPVLRAEEVLPTTPPKNSDSVKPPQEAPLVEFEDEDYEFDPIGKRDPFKPFIKIIKPVTDAPQTKAVVVKGKTVPVVVTDPLMKYGLDEYKVLGILSNTSNPRALIEIEGKTFVLYRNMKLGRNNGVIREIREGEIVVSEQIEIDGRMRQETKLLQIK